MEDTIITSNLNFTTAMVSWGCDLDKTDKVDRKRTVFYLSHPPVTVWTKRGEDLEPLHSGTFNSLFQLFNTHKLMLLPTYPDTLKMMKNLIYGY